MEARNVPFVVLSMLYLLPLVSEVLSGVEKTRAEEPARWEGFLNLILLPFVVITAAIARPTLYWMPPWFVVLVVALQVDVLGFLVWWAACVITGKVVAARGGST